MLDTVALKRYYKSQPSKKFLIENGWIYRKNSKFPTWIKNNSEGKTKPRLSLIITPDDVVHIKAEVSLPKLILGHNVKLLDESQTELALQQISEYVEIVSGYHFEAKTARVSRVDYTRDYKLASDKVIPTIAAMSRKALPRRNRLIYGDSTLYFKNKNNTQEISLYSKLHEVIANSSTSSEIIELARGILRLECSFVGVKTINALKDRLGLSGPTADFLLTKEVSDFVLLEAEKSLNLNPFANSVESVVTKLLNMFGAARTMRLLGFLGFVRHFGEHFYKDASLGVKKDSYYRDASDIRKAGAQPADPNLLE